MLMIALFLIFCTIAITGYVIIPMVSQQASVLSVKRQQTITNRIEQLLPRQEARKMSRIFLVAPVILGAAFYFLAPTDQLRWVAAVLGILAGFIFPGMYVNILRDQTRFKFTDQLVDALMIMSSSFRGGLSLVQAIEAVVEEMPNPIKREFGVVLGENKMGVGLDESLHRLSGRMPSVALQQMTTAILLARETGGNLPVIFSRIVSTMRERKKIEQNLNMLTIQGKIQAVVMTGLPVIFVMGVSASNPKFFDVMFRIPEGQQILMICAVLWVVGAFFIWQISRFKDF